MRPTHDGSSWLARGRRVLDREEPPPEFQPDAGSIQAPETGRCGSMSELTKAVTDESFRQDVLEAPGPVLVDFWAEWCGPCKMIAPILDEIAQEQAGKVKIVKLNVDENQETARRFDVMSIPTLIVFEDGQPAKKMIGAKGKGALLEDLAEFL